MIRGAESYSQALYSLARDEALDTAICEELEILDKAFSQEPTFLRLLSSPNLSREERCAVIDDSFRGKVHPYVLNFLKILSEKRHMGCFGDCCKVYRERYNADHGIVSVLAVTAVALTDEQSEKLQNKLQQVTGKTVQLRNRVDPACMGGVRLDYDGKRVDATVKSRLDALRRMLDNTVL